MLKKILISLSITLTLTACAERPSETSGKLHPKEINYGIIQDNVYRNDYFGLSLDVPENWSIQSQAAMKDLMEIGSSLVAGDDKNLKRVLKESEKQTITLFSFFKHEAGAPVTFNPSIIAVAERVKHAPGVKSGADYHFHAKKLLQSGQIEYKFPNDIYTEVISGISFDVMPTEITAAGTIVKQEYYAERMKDYVLLFILSYAEDSEKNELKNILNRADFSN